MTHEGGLRCPVCGGQTQRDFEAHGYWIRACIACGHRLAEIPTDAAHARRVYGDGYFNGDRAGYPDYLAEASIIAATGRHYARVVGERRGGPPGRVLDVGAAAGLILRSFVQAGWTGVGLEPNPTMAAIGRDRFGLDVRDGTLETFTTDERFDLVTMIQVLPHFWDLRRALSVAAEVTAPDGWWLIETWDRTSLTARVMGRRWHEYSPPSVLHWFSRDGVADIASDHGFEEVAHGRRLKWIAGARAVTLLDHSLGDTPIGPLVRAAGKIVPRRLPYPSEDLFWTLLRKRG